MADKIKRLHYFDHQFLREPDFTAEQNYHMDMRRLHQRVAHTPGVAEGLTLTAAIGATSVTIEQGTAFDRLGREIKLTEDTETGDLSSNAGNRVFVILAYNEQQTDETSETGISGRTRWTEDPIIRISVDPPGLESSELVLGQVTVGDDGLVSEIEDGVSPNHRRKAGVVGGDFEASRITLSRPGVVSDQWPTLRARQAGNDRGIDVGGALHVAGRVNDRDMVLDGQKLDQHVVDTGNPHSVTAEQVGALTVESHALQRHLKVLTGTFNVGQLGGELPSMIDSQVTFSTGYFSESPAVVASLGMLDVNEGDSLRVNASVLEESVSVNGFTLRVFTWATTIVFSAAGSWIAIGY